MRGTRRGTVALAAALVGVMLGVTAPAGGAEAVGADGAGRREITVTRLTTGDGRPVNGSYLELNERGQVAATLYDTEPVSSVVVLWQRGRVTQLSPDGIYAHPLDISDRGHVVGEIYDRSGTFPTDWGIRPFSWFRGRWSQIASDETKGRAVDVNRRGQVVGQLDTPPYNTVWEAGEMVALPPGAGAGLVNGRGQVMGDVANEAGKAEATTWRLGEEGAGAVTRLGTLGGDTSRGVDINESGDIAGNSTTADGQQHAFLWRDGEMIDLGTLGGEISWAVDVNDRGDVVGNSITADGEGHAFLWRDGEMIDLGWLGSADPYDIYPKSEAAAVNNHGQVVGYSYTPDQQHAFLWEDGRMTDIGAVGDLAHESHSRAVDINDRGQIVGEVAEGDASAAVLWTAPPGRPPG
jgi:probable HAF family extracellular repeat protein